MADELRDVVVGFRTLLVVQRVFPGYGIAFVNGVIVAVGGREDPMRVEDVTATEVPVEVIRQLGTYRYLEDEQLHKSIRLTVAVLNG